MGGHSSHHHYETRYYESAESVRISFGRKK